jgi:hypothetical protein
VADVNSIEILTQPLEVMEENQERNSNSDEVDA